jgi:hypothetical protein
MNRLSINHLAYGVTILLLVIPCLSVFGQTINVTMVANTATNRDTVMTYHTLQIRGEASGDVVPAVTWGDDTGLGMENIGGDYWETTFQMTYGDTLRYKFWTGFDATTGTFFWEGWEGPLNPADPFDSGGNRTFIAGNQDTTVALQFYNGAEATRDQLWRPYETKPDSFAVFFRVNIAALMETGEFDPDADGPVGVRGSPPIATTADDWDVEIPLTREEGSVDSGSFYSGAAYVANDSISGGDEQSYKFVYRNGTAWESTPNRVFTYSGAKDTTIHWAYFNDQKPSGGNLVEAVLTWRVKTDGLEKLGFFDRSLGERIVIDGATGWDVANAIEMNYVPLLQLWLGQETFTKAPGASFEYKPVLLWDDSRVDSNSPNYIPGLDLTSPLQYWEESATTGSGNRLYDYTNQTEQSMPGDFGFEYQYFNGLPAEGVIETPITLTFSIDMTPATDVNTNPSNPLFRPGVDSCEISFLGCLMPLTQGYGIYTNSKVVNLDDPEGDLIYTGSWELTPPTTFAAGFRVNYTSETGTISNGGGFGKGRTYYQFVHPNAVNADGTIQWPSEFSFPVLQWMDSDLTVEDPPDLWTPTDVQLENNSLGAQTFKLAQNYPNPFNPATTINYQVAKKSHVQISIYNMTGQLVKTLVNEQQNRGEYSVQWNGKDHRGNDLPTGVYIAKMVADSYEQTMKMMLIR